MSSAPAGPIPCERRYAQTIRRRSWLLSQQSHQARPAWAKRTWTRKLLVLLRHSPTHHLNIHHLYGMSRSEPIRAPRHRVGTCAPVAPTRIPTRDSARAQRQRRFDRARSYRCAGRSESPTESAHVPLCFVDSDCITQRQRELHAHYAQTLCPWYVKDKCYTRDNIGFA